MPEHFPLSILVAEILGIHPEPFHLEGVRIVLAGGKDGCVAVVGHRDINDNDNILPPSTHKEAFDHHIIIFIVPTEDELGHSLQTDVIRIDFPDTAIRQCPETDSFEPHGQLTILPNGF
jgi:hypothetical protein